MYIFTIKLLAVIRNNCQFIDYLSKVLLFGIYRKKTLCLIIIIQKII